MTKFTPGPREIAGNLIGSTTANKLVAIVEEGQTANAHLISAAPEMYEALGKIVKITGEYKYEDPLLTDLHNIARTTLKKARGEKQYDEMLALAIRLQKWINKHGHPHMKIIIENDSVEIIEGVVRWKTDEYVPD